MADSSAEANSKIFDAKSYENNPELEEAWALSTVEHMEIHFNLITVINPQTLKLTRHDDELYSAFKSNFPDFKLDVLEVQSLKSEESKVQWRKFIDQYKDKVDDATMGTLVRINCCEEYNETNTIFVVRLQFMVIEIARNKEGLNNEIYEKHRNTKK